MINNENETDERYWKLMSMLIDNKTDGEFRRLVATSPFVLDKNRHPGTYATLIDAQAKLRMPRSIQTKKGSAVSAGIPNTSATGVKIQIIVGDDEPPQIHQCSVDNATRLLLYCIHHDGHIQDALRSKKLDSLPDMIKRALLLFPRNQGPAALTPSDELRAQLSQVRPELARLLGSTTGEEKEVSVGLAEASFQEVCRQFPWDMYPLGPGKILRRFVLAKQVRAMADGINWRPPVSTSTFEWYIRKECRHLLAALRHIESATPNRETPIRVTQARYVMNLVMPGPMAVKEMISNLSRANDWVESTRLAAFAAEKKQASSLAVYLLTSLGSTPVNKDEDRLEKNQRHLPLQQEDDQEEQEYDWSPAIMQSQDPQDVHQQNSSSNHVQTYAMLTCTPSTLERLQRATFCAAGPWQVEVEGMADRLFSRYMMASTRSMETTAQWQYSMLTAALGVSHKKEEVPEWLSNGGLTALLGLLGGEDDVLDRLLCDPDAPKYFFHHVYCVLGLALHEPQKAGAHLSRLGSRALLVYQKRLAPTATEAIVAEWKQLVAQGQERVKRKEIALTLVGWKTKCTVDWKTLLAPGTDLANWFCASPISAFFGFMEMLLREAYVPSPTAAAVLFPLGRPASQYAQVAAAHADTTSLQQLLITRVGLQEDARVEANEVCRSVWKEWNAFLRRVADNNNHSSPSGSGNGRGGGAFAGRGRGGGGAPHVYRGRGGRGGGGGYRGGGRGGRGGRGGAAGPGPAILHRSGGQGGEGPLKRNATASGLSDRLANDGNKRRRLDRKENQDDQVPRDEEVVVHTHTHCSRAVVFVDRVEEMMNTTTSVPLAPMGLLPMPRARNSARNNLLVVQKKNESPLCPWLLQRTRFGSVLGSTPSNNPTMKWKKEKRPTITTMIPWKLKEMEPKDQVPKELNPPKYRRQPRRIHWKRRQPSRRRRPTPLKNTVLRPRRTISITRQCRLLESTPLLLPRPTNKKAACLAG